MESVARVTFGLILLATACASAEQMGSTRTEAETAVPAATDAASFELTAGIVVTPSTPAIYLARPGGGIEALDPESGQPLWRSDAAARPLLVDGDRLLAQSETGTGLPLALLDRSSGELLRRLDARLPAGVRAAIDESLEGRFQISARLMGDGAVVEWEYLERHALGVSPPEGRPFARRERGALRLDLESLAAIPVDPAQPVAGLGDVLPAPVEQLVASGELARRPWRVGELLAVAEQRYDTGGSRLLLRRWWADSGEALPEVTLMEGRPVAVLASADRRHLLVVTSLEAGEVGGESYRWAVHSLTTGEPVAGRTAELSASPFCLLPGMLLHVAPPSGRRVEGAWQERPYRLRAVDPASGAGLWQRAVRDPVFRGPAPPRP